MDGGGQGAPATRSSCSGEYAPGAKDFSDLILKAKAANADAVFALPTPPDGMTMIKQMKELGYTPKLTLFDPRRRPADLVEEPRQGRRLHRARGRLAQRHEGAGREGAERRAPEEVRAPADPIVGPAYACVQILAAAITRAGSADREKIRDAIAATDMITVIGPVKFRPDGTGIVQAGVRAVAATASRSWSGRRSPPRRRSPIPAPPFAKR